MKIFTLKTAILKVFKPVATIVFKQPTFSVKQLFEPVSKYCFAILFKMVDNNSDRVGEQGDIEPKVC